MADPSNAQLLHEQIHIADSSNPDPALATTLLLPRVNWQQHNRQMQAANFAKQNGVYSVGQISNATSLDNTNIYVFGLIAGLALLAFAL